MDDVMFVNVIHRLADLPHEDWASLLCEDEFIIENSVEQLAALNSKTKKCSRDLGSRPHTFVHSDSQFQNNADHFVVLERIVKLNDFRVLQAIHHFDLALDIFAFLSILHCDEFRRQTQTRGLLFAFVNRSEFASKQ